jgi:hypothetical protein
MRLLNTKSLELSPPYVPSEVPDYVILSHRWSTEEVTFANISKAPISDLQSPSRTKSGFAKIEGACKLALRDGYTWIWIDSCCIDKSSSAELQEAINSMWRYYEESNICYVYLADVPDSHAGWGRMFAGSVWWSRGWTLQELLAPVCVEFYANNWEPIGTKLERHEQIAEITLINPNALIREKAIDLFSTAERFSWAAHRNVTREEDEAYSLLGLFDVNMPLLYGEGRAKAFARLQEAIYSSTADQSMFLFRHSLYYGSQPLLADSPTRFCERIDCTSCPAQAVRCFPSAFRYADIIASEQWGEQPHEQIMTTVTKSRIKISTDLSLLDYRNVCNMFESSEADWPQTRATHVAVLNCTLRRHQYGALCLLLDREPNKRDSWHRLLAFPVLLPHLRDLVPSLQKTKLLFCRGSAFQDFNNSINQNFSFRSDLFRVEKWNVMIDSFGQHSVLAAEAREDSGFDFQTWKPGFLKQSVAIFCRIVDSQDPSLLLSVHLIQVGEIWSIKEIFEGDSECNRDQKLRSLFQPYVLTDRGSIHLPDGRSLLVGLRRLPSSACARKDRNKTVSKTIRYQITVGLISLLGPVRPIQIGLNQLQYHEPESEIESESEWESPSSKIYRRDSR